MYTPVERMRYEACACDPRGFGSGQDEAADLKASGGFNVKKSNICGGCFEAMSVNGTCGCP
jgi:hypothetical protein